MDIRRTHNTCTIKGDVMAINHIPPEVDSERGMLISEEHPRVREAIWHPFKSWVSLIYGVDDVIAEIYFMKCKDKYFGESTLMELIEYRKSKILRYLHMFFMKS